MFEKVSAVDEIFGINGISLFKIIFHVRPIYKRFKQLELIESHSLEYVNIHVRMIPTYKRGTPVKSKFVPFLPS